MISDENEYFLELLHTTETLIDSIKKSEEIRKVKNWFIVSNSINIWYQIDYKYKYLLHFFISY